MSEAEVLMTQEGLKQKEDELEQLKTVRRREVADRIKQAIEFGDISENSEYEDAKNEQAFIEGQILNLEKMLKNARILDDDGIVGDVVSEYSTVIVENLTRGGELKFQIVGSVESNPFEQKLSNESPIGSAVLGHRVGDEFDVSVPAGVMKMRIKEIIK